MQNVGIETLDDMGPGMSDLRLKGERVERMRERLFQMVVIANVS